MTTTRTARSPRWTVTISQNGSSVTNVYAGPAPVAIARAVSRFSEVHPFATGKVFAQADDYISVGLEAMSVWRGTYTVDGGQA